MVDFEAAWKTKFINANAQAVAEELNSLFPDVKSDQLPDVPPETIVDYAREHPESELHKCFTWDNDEAAEKWRKHEARLIACNLIIVKVKRKVIQPPVRFIVQNEKERGYKQTIRIFQNASETEKLLNTAIAELRTFEFKYHTLRDTKLGSVLKAIEEVI